MSHDPVLSFIEADRDAIGRPPPCWEWFEVRPRLRRSAARRRNKYPAYTMARLFVSCLRHRYVLETLEADAKPMALDLIAAEIRSICEGKCLHSRETYSWLLLYSIGGSAGFDLVTLWLKQATRREKGDTGEQLLRVSLRSTIGREIIGIIEANAGRVRGMLEGSSALHDVEDPPYLIHDFLTQAVHVR